MTNFSEINRQFSMEGATHLYSSLPAMLTPADLYRAKDNPVLKAALSDCNIYLIVRRSRIYLNSDRFRLDGRTIFGEFLVMREQGMVVVSFEYEISILSVPDGIDIHDVAVAVNGSSLVVLTSKGEQLIAVSAIVAEAKSELRFQDTDLEVLYIGQSVGRTETRTALDRLLLHSKFQQILAETSTHFPEREVIVLLYRFEHGRTIISNGGDFNAEVQASFEQDSAHLERLRKIQLSRKEVVSLAEAGLINYFKPYYNSLIKSADFTAKNKIKILKKLIEKGVSGLVVELCTRNLRSRIGTARAVPLDLADIFSAEILSGKNIDDEGTKNRWQEQLNEMAHSHIAKFPLTTLDERNTFLHGNTFNVQSEDRSGLWF